MAPLVARGRRWVLHLDMDAFFASVEQLTRPTLRGRPILVGGLGERGVVAGASYEARACGARSAMPMRQARRLVGPSAVVLAPRRVVIDAMSTRVFDVVRSRVATLEQLSVDEAFVEPDGLVGADETQVRRYCELLREQVYAQTGLVASVGAGSGKQIAKIASGLAKPNGVRVIAPDVEQQVLGSLPVRKLWGIGPVAEAKLHRLGIDTIGAFAAMSERDVVATLGAAAGTSLHRLARGVDDRPVTARAEAKQVSAETTFEVDLTTRRQLLTAVDHSVVAAYRRLCEDGRGARTVVVKLKRTDMSVLTRSVTLPYATTDAGALGAAARRSVPDPSDIGPVRLVGVGFGGLSPARQDSLFPELDRIDPTEPSVEDSERVAGDADPVVHSTASDHRWQPGTDVAHPDYGHGWVQGAGHGVVTVRFETRSSGPGAARTFAVDDPILTPADPLHSLR